MVNLARNQRTFWYALYAGRTTVKDSDGNDTGEPCVAYSAPVAARGNVSAASGNAQQEQFGIGVTYDVVIQLPGTDWPIDEYAVLWLSKPPAATYDPTSPGNDYAVVRVSKSLNQTSVAARRVTSDG